ncbi:hypothetical protein AVEN_102345-1 [Araneus ventricosus]|uniref:Tc1-like transposase DDE domain-containing protein n=1 Tax=Araneus ventricosus TaxID=182803 RepID=A0A4Y2QSK0_ARAVE|nr:hypothetical protein AVEN_102345-1 [Araneus ventricosus]
MSRASESISIVGVMQKRSDLSDVQKGMIIGFRAKGGSISETANFVNCSRAAVVKLYREWQYGTIQNQRRGTCGAPRAIDDKVTEANEGYGDAFGQIDNDGIYQQDKARCHTARSICAWFEEHQDEFTVLPWPANSPDLNPIENLWDHLDRVVRGMDPQPRNLAQLATTLE